MINVMEYSWEVFNRSYVNGLYGSMSPPWVGHEEAGDPLELAARIRPRLLPGQRLNIWDTDGVGRLPVLTADA
jgi:hypothetical protein